MTETTDGNASSIDVNQQEYIQYAVGMDQTITQLVDGLHNSDDPCKFRRVSHICTDIQPRCHGVLATPSRSGATVVRGAGRPL